MKKEYLTLKKRLSQYTLMTGPMLAMASLANAQVIYTDIDPDYFLTDSTAGDGAVQANLDLDNDGVMDLALFVAKNTFFNSQYNFNLAAAKPYSANGNGIIAYGVLPYYWASAFNAGSPIDSNEIFLTQANNYDNLAFYYIPGEGGYGFYGQWNNVTDKYMGVHFTGGDGNQHYGWIRMDVNNNPAAIILKDFAYESQDNVGINTGDLPTAINAAKVNDKISIVAFEKSVYISAPTTSNDPMVVRVTDLMGQTLIEQSSTENNLRLNLRDLASSLYLVTVQKGALTKSAKVSLR